MIMENLRSYLRYVEYRQGMSENGSGGEQHHRTPYRDKAAAEGTGDDGVGRTQPIGGGHCGLNDVCTPDPGPAGGGGDGGGSSENKDEYDPVTQTHTTQENILHSAVFIGRKMKQNALLHFYHGGGGYVLNQAAVSILYDLFTNFPDECLNHVHTSMEDVMNARCLLHAGIHVDDVLDPVSGKHIFHPFSPMDAFNLPDTGSNTSNSSNNSTTSSSSSSSSCTAPYDDENLSGGDDNNCVQKNHNARGPSRWWDELISQLASHLHGTECCSDYSISFQNLLPDHMYCLYDKLYGRNGDGAQ